MKPFSLMFDIVIIFLRLPTFTFNLSVNALAFMSRPRHSTSSVELPIQHGLLVLQFPLILVQMVLPIFQFQLYQNTTQEFVDYEQDGTFNLADPYPTHQKWY